ncbi:hypothetical protein JCM11491_004667 [Sporobolomyces phaffii]
MSLLASAGICALACSVAQAVKVPPPTAVDAADPLPGEAPHHDSEMVPPASADFIASARVVSSSGSAVLAPYDGVEYRLGPLAIRPAHLHLEACFLVGFVVYALATVAIRARNRTRARTWFAANARVLRREFAGVGFGTDPEGFKADGGGSECVSYVSGRRAIESGWVRLDLGAYDLLTEVYRLVRPVVDPNYDARDKVVLDFKLAQPVGTPGAKHLCFAVLRREQLKALQDARWDLRTLTTLSESVPVSPELIVMTESGDVTSALIYDHVTGLKDALKAGADDLESFESLVVSDLPATEPSSTRPTLPADDLHLILTLRLPRRGSNDGYSAESLITLACNVADVLHQKEKLLPEVAILKAKKRRTAALDQLRAALKDETSATKRAELGVTEAKRSATTPGEGVKSRQSRKDDDKERKKRRR